MQWHLEHCERVPRGRCAGCRDTIAAREVVLELADGNRVHLTDNYACLIAWVERWRRAARHACSSAELDVPLSRFAERAFGPRGGNASFGSTSAPYQSDLAIGA